MNLHKLITHWNNANNGQKVCESYQVRLPRNVAAKLHALEQMFPSQTKEQLITELLTAALEELEEGFPYVPGGTPVAVDEFNDPIYEDIGRTAEFALLTRKSLRSLA